MDLRAGPGQWLWTQSPCPFYIPDEVADNGPKLLSTTDDVLSVGTAPDGDEGSLLLFAWAFVLAQYANSTVVSLTSHMVGTSMRSLSLRVEVEANLSMQQALEALTRELQQWTRLSPQWTEADSSGGLAQKSAPTVSLVMPWRHQSAAVPDHSNHDVIRMVLEDSAGALRCRVLYNRHACCPLQATRMLHQFVHITRQLTGADAMIRPGVVGQLSPSTALDLSTVAQWNERKVIPVLSCLQDLVAQRARRSPITLAVSAWDGKLSYYELNELASQLAGRICQSGLPKGSRVALLFEKSRWMVVSVLAVLKAGGVCLGLCHTFPNAYIQRLLGEAQPSLILCSSGQAARLREIGCAAWMVPDLLEEPSPPCMPPFVHLGSIRWAPQDPAFVIFTSGSTGKPKGAVLTHEAIMTTTHYQAETVNIGAGSRVLQFSSHAWDVFVMETWWALARGGCLCIPSETQRVEALPEFMAEHRPSAAFFTPTVLRSYRPGDMPSLDAIVIGGENVPRDLVRQWDGHAQLFDLWGPAETAGASVMEIDSSTWIPGTFGRGTACRLWITRPHDPGQLAAVGTVGEVLIEGVIVAQGYLHDPVRTQQAFIPAPPWRAQVPYPVQGRFYRTGDFVHYNPDGSMRYVGRQGSIIKINGQRVDADAVETAARAQTGGCNVSVDAIALKQTRSGGSSTVLVAFLETALGAEVVDTPPTSSSPSCPAIRDPAACAEAASTLQHCLAQELPAFMIPVFIIPLAVLPRTTTGKLDRKRMREFARTFSHDSLIAWLAGGRSQNTIRAASGAPLSTAEQLLVTTIATVLGIETAVIELDTTLRQLGGDSVSAVRLARALAERGYSLSVSSLVNAHLSLKDLAARMQRSARMETSTDPKPFSLLSDTLDEPQILALREGAAQQCQVSLTDVEDIYPCTPMQEGLVTATVTLSPDVYVDRFLFQLPSATTADRLQNAWKSVACRVPLLRTRIVQSHTGDAFQVIVSQDPPWQRYSTRDAFTQADGAMPMTLGAPLLRLSLIDQPVRQLAMTIHHALYDRWTLSLVLGLVDSAYAGSAFERPRPFSSFVRHLQQHRQPEETAQFWKREMADLPPITYPEYPSPDYQPRASCAVALTAPRTPSADASPTVQMRLAWAFLLSLYQGSDDVVYGTVVDGRRIDLPGLEGLFGPTLATVPCRTRIQNTMTVRDALRQVQDQMVAMSAFEQSGLQHIARASSDAALAARFRSLLVVQPDADEQVESAVLGPAETVLGSLGEFPGYGLILLCHCTAQKWSLELLVDESLVPRSQAERMLQQLAHLLREMASADRRLSQLHLLCAADETQLAKWQATVPPDVDRYVDDLVVRRGKPLAVTIDAWDGQFTWAQLEQEVCRFSAYLYRCHNARRHDMVPILMQRSRWVPVAMLAVMKIGAAFVLLDHAQSASHHRQICQVVQAKLAVSCGKCVAQARQLVDSVVVLGSPTEEAARRSLCPEDGRIGGLGDVERKVSDAAYVVFTSGSTGEPKGVVVEHRQSAAAILAQHQHLQITSQSRVLQLSSFAFDSFAVEILTTLGSGGCVCIPTDEQCRDDIAGAVQRFQATWMVITPSLLRLLEVDEVPTLRTVVAVGESMLPSQAAQWAGHVQLLCGYGPTECCTGASVHPVVAPASSTAVDVRNIGAGMGARLWVVHREDHHTLVPIGTVGELLIEGPIVGREYLHNPMKTQEAFLDTAHGVSRVSRRTHRLYKTGDLVRYTGDGGCLFLGRKSQQVKLRGQRLDVTEVERHLHQAFGPGSRIVAAAIQPKGDQSHPLLVAMVHDWRWEGEDHGHQTPSRFLSPSLAFTRTALRVQESLRASLPPVMMPALYLRVSRMPLLASGKINRAALHQAAAKMTITELLTLGRLSLPGEDEILSSVETTAWTLTQWLAEILKRKLPPHDQQELESLVVGRNVPHARFGLDSIDTVAFSRRIAQQFGVTIPATTILQTTLTVRALARMIDTQQGGTESLYPPSDSRTADWWRDYQQLAALVDKLPAHPRHVCAEIACHQQPRAARRVFVTGATGYLGTRILHQLLCNPGVHSVTVLVRAGDARQAMARIVRSARKSQWWREDFRRVIVPWPGDLARPQLGLADAQWEALCGRHHHHPERFDAIIHSGAVVHWVYDYSRLRGPNVQGTLSLLTALSRCHHRMRFTYVSTLQPGVDTIPSGDDAYNENPALTIGYTQTKYVSEMLIERFVKQRADQHAVAIVRPGLMIGSVVDGMANTDDVIWRTVSAALDIGAYNGEEEDAWLYVAPVDSVAAVVIHETLYRPRPAGEPSIALTNIEDGVFIRDFWHAIRHVTMQPLAGLPGVLWLTRIRTRLEAASQAHPLWPVMEFIEAMVGRLGSPPKNTARLQPASLDSIIWMAVVRNAQYLCSLGLGETLAADSSRRTEGPLDRILGG